MDFELSRQLVNRLDYVDSTGSTNTDLVAVATDRPDLSVLVSGHQTAGRGRATGRQWSSPAGSSLAISVLLKPNSATGQALPPTSFSWLPLLAGLAMARDGHLPVALAVMLGADVGTSLMAVVFSLDLSWLSPLLLFVGVVTFLSREGTPQGRFGRILIAWLSTQPDAMLVAAHAAAQAVAQSLEALRWLQGQGAQQIYFKYCSTFDSTPEGNIGPVTEALMDALGCDFTIATPAFPDNGRTVFKGYLFAGNVLLNESGMQNHPLTPMTDANLVRVMQSQTQHKVGFLYGHIEARMWLPEGIGTWPAFWLLGADINAVDWPDCGELDIMEQNNDKTGVHGTIHSNSDGADVFMGMSGARYAEFGSSYASSWHTYAVNWMPDRIEWLVDGEVYYELGRMDVEGAGFDWVFDHENFIIINLAMGGAYVGGINPDGPAQMKIDYVRVSTYDGYGVVTRH